MQKQLTPEQILAKLRHTGFKLCNDMNAPEDCRQVYVSGQTYYHWYEYGRHNPLVANYMKGLEKPHDADGGLDIGNGDMVRGELYILADLKRHRLGYESATELRAFKVLA